MNRFTPAIVGVLAAACSSPMVSLGDDQPDPPSLSPPEPPESATDGGVVLQPPNPDAGGDEPTTDATDASVPHGIDLTTAFLTAGPITLASRAMLHVEVSVTNLADTNSPAPNLAFYLDPLPRALLVQRATVIPRLSTRSFPIDLELPTALGNGDYVLRAVVDFDNGIHEVDETNNESDLLKVVVTDLVVDTQPIDFGQVAVDCRARAETLLSNAGLSDILITAIRYDNAASAELAIDTQTPLQLRPGEQTMLELRYEPIDVGDDRGILSIENSQTTSPIEIDVGGAGVNFVPHVDRWVQVASQVDILIVLDTSYSMTDEAPLMEAELGDYADWLVNEQYDFHLAVTTMDTAYGATRGRMIGNPTILTPAIADVRGQLVARVTGAPPTSEAETGFDAAQRALTEPLSSNDNAGFLRADAGLAVIFVSDEEDQSAESVLDLTNLLTGLKGGPGQVVVNAIVGDEPIACMSADGSGSKYIALANELGGMFQSVCSGPWGATLHNFGQANFGLLSIFPLSFQPKDPTRIQVNVNGLPIPANEWSYSAELNAVSFDARAQPEPGAVITIWYSSAC